MSGMAPRELGTDFAHPSGMNANPEARFRAALSKLGCQVMEKRDGRSWQTVTSVDSYGMLSLGMNREDVWRQLLLMVLRRRCNVA